MTFFYSTSDGPVSSFADDFLLETNSEEEEFACRCSPSSSLMLASFTSFAKAVMLSAFTSWTREGDLKRMIVVDNL